MLIDLKEMPYSVYGSYLVLGHLNRKQQTESLYLRSVHGEESDRGLFRIGVYKYGKEVTCRETAVPGLLTLEGPEGARVLITYENEKALRFRAENCELRLERKMADGLCLMYSLGNAGYEVNVSSHKMRFFALKGTVKGSAPWAGTCCLENMLFLNPEEGPVGEAILEEYENMWETKGYVENLEELAEKWGKHYEAFLTGLPKVPAKYENAREKAAYINWSCIVYPKGNLKRDTMLMSKNWMSNVWSWDHCFNAMALAQGNPKLSWDQFMVMFDQQDAFGALPDAMNDTVMIRSFVKPPIHGLTLSWLMEHGWELTMEQKKEIYPKLCGWTDFWMNCRDTDQDGIPEYHHGNDSGWDNSTIFNHSAVIEGTDLSAFLVLQMETLEKLAGELDRSEEQEVWRQRREKLLETMLVHFEKDGSLKGCISGSHEVGSRNTLLNYMVLILGERLPKEIREQLLEELLEERTYETKWGFATERVDSPFYQRDGYWRGPIWAPSTWLLVEGLKACGKTEKARQTAEKFCELCVRSGFAENFDALSGEGLRDRAYTWTASVFLLLASELGEGAKDQEL